MELLPSFPSPNSDLLSKIISLSIFSSPEGSYESDRLELRERGWMGEGAFHLLERMSCREKGREETRWRGIKLMNLLPESWVFSVWHRNLIRHVGEFSMIRLPHNEIQIRKPFKGKLKCYFG